MEAAFGPAMERLEPLRRGPERWGRATRTHRSECTMLPELRSGMVRGPCAGFGDAEWSLDLTRPSKGLGILFCR